VTSCTVGGKYKRFGELHCLGTEDGDNTFFLVRIALMMEAVMIIMMMMERTSQTSVDLYQATRRYNPYRTYRCKLIKSSPTKQKDMKTVFESK
jgi:hypothetical protein